MSGQVPECVLSATKFVEHKSSLTLHFIVRFRTISATEDQVPKRDQGLECEARSLRKVSLSLLLCFLSHSLIFVFATQEV